VNRKARRALARAFRPRKPRKGNGTRYHRPNPLSAFANVLPEGRTYVRRGADTMTLCANDVAY
jgi:hypothetical protein